MCVRSVRHMPITCVGMVCMLVGLCVYHVMLWPREELSPQRKSTANNSTAIGMEPYHPRGLWDRVYNQTQSVGGQNP